MVGRRASRSGHNTSVGLVPVIPQKKPRRLDKAPQVHTSGSTLRLLALAPGTQLGGFQGARCRLCGAETAGPACPLLTPFVREECAQGMCVTCSVTSMCPALVGCVWLSSRCLPGRKGLRSVSEPREKLYRKCPSATFLCACRLLPHGAHVLWCHNLKVLCTSPLYLSEASACLGSFSLINL